LSNNEYTPYTKALDESSDPITSDIIDVAVFNKIASPTPYIGTVINTNHFIDLDINRKQTDPAAIIKHPRNKGLSQLPKYAINFL